MRKRATYAFGGHFIAPHKSMLFLSYSGVSGEGAAPAEGSGGDRL